MGPSWLQSSSGAGILPGGVMECRQSIIGTPAQICARSIVGAPACRAQQLPLSSRRRETSESEQRRAPLAQSLQGARDRCAAGRAIQEGGRKDSGRWQQSSRSKRQRMVPRAAAASLGTDGPDGTEEGSTSGQQDGIQGREHSRTPAAFEEVSKIVRLHWHLYSAAKNSDEILWVTLRSSTLLFTALAALSAALYSDVCDPQFRASLQAKLKRFAAEQPEQVSKRLKETDYQQLAREVGAAVRSAAVRVWAATPGPIRWPAAVFTCFYALVVLVFGRPVARDLGPLWVIGPVLLSYAVWQTQVVARVTPQLVERTRQLALQGAAEAKELAANAQSGKLLTDSVAEAERIKSKVERRMGEVLQLVSTNQAALVKYVGEGELEKDSKNFAEAKVEEVKSGLTKWAIRRWEDLGDWWFLVSRRSRKR